MTDWYDTGSLPKFKHPPVVETAMAVEFAPIPGMDFFRLTRLQSEWEDRYPSVSDRPGAPPTPPTFDGTQSMQFNFGDVPRRIWAQGETNGLLVQSQSDRLILNWRKEFSDTDYPGYGNLRNEFALLWSEYTAFVDTTKLPAIAPLLAEFNYINAVPLTESDELQDVVTVVRTPPQELPGKDRFGRFQFIRDVSESDEHPYTAQIHIVGEPQEPEPGKRQLVFTVIARAILGAKAGDPLAGLDAAHALASQTFARIVTDEKQKEWERFQ